MKLLVIVLCLLSERFLEHKSAHYRFCWFNGYFNAMVKRLPSKSVFRNPYVIISIILVTPMIGVAFVYYYTAQWIYGLVGLLFNVAIFHYCIGPANPFYPEKKDPQGGVTDDIINYLVQVNGQLFAILFWYVCLGPLAILFYRLISLCRDKKMVSEEASWLTRLLDWLPARMTALLYLLLGNFQKGFQHFYKLFFSLPLKNDALLVGCGTEALLSDHTEELFMPSAERLVEHSLMAFLVFLAFFTILLWV